MDRIWDEEEFDLEAIQARQDALEEDLMRQENERANEEMTQEEESIQKNEDTQGEESIQEDEIYSGEDNAADWEAQLIHDDELNYEADVVDRDAAQDSSRVLDVTKVLVMEDYSETGSYPESDWEAIVEAVLFTMGQPVELRQLAVAIDQNQETAERVMESLSERYERENRGMQVMKLEDSYQLCTRGKYYENLIRVAVAPKRHTLTEVVLETLSIIAYKQPVTRLEIEKIRGVNSDHAVNRLVEYGLVEEIGRLDAPGRPALFATTEEFLRRFGIGSKESLPDMDPVRAAEIRSEVEEELQIDLGEFENGGKPSEESEPEQG